MPQNYEVKSDDWEELQDLLNDEDYQEWLAVLDLERIAALEAEQYALDLDITPAHVRGLWAVNPV